jgi:hypothetical protein
LLLFSEDVDGDHVRVSVLKKCEPAIPTHFQEGNFIHAGARVPDFARVMGAFIAKLELYDIVAHANASPEV